MNTLASEQLNLENGGLGDFPELATCFPLLFEEDA